MAIVLVAVCWGSAAINETSWLQSILGQKVQGDVPYQCFVFAVGVYVITMVAFVLRAAFGMSDGFARLLIQRSMLIVVSGIPCAWLFMGKPLGKAPETGWAQALLVLAVILIWSLASFRWRRATPVEPGRSRRRPHPSHGAEASLRRARRRGCRAGARGGGVARGRSADRDTHGHLGIEPVRTPFQRPCPSRKCRPGRFRATLGSAGCPKNGRRRRSAPRRMVLADRDHGDRDGKSRPDASSGD